MARQAIYVNKGSQLWLAKIFATTIDEVRLALDCKTHDAQARSIRAVAQTSGGAVIDVAPRRRRLVRIYEEERL